jgi:hypothetical protein
LLVNGKSTSAVVLQLDGRSYIDIETLAQITNGSVKFEPNQVVLTIPNSNFDANSPQTTAALSKDFASAAIATLADMKEWKGVLGTMVTFGLAVDGFLGSDLSRSGADEFAASNCRGVNQFRS